jgi:hypothetical protein
MGASGLGPVLSLGVPGTLALLLAIESELGARGLAFVTPELSLGLGLVASYIATNLNAILGGRNSTWRFII